MESSSASNAISFWMPHATGEWMTVLFGLMIVFIFARRRFNEPTTTESKALPQAVEPLRYMFLKSEYGNARRLYTLFSLLLYMLLAIGVPPIIKGLGFDKAVTPQSWGLMSALILVGLLPSPPNAKWIIDVEKEIRKFVHSRYLVPARVEQTIALLQDIRYVPPDSQIAQMSATRRPVVIEGLCAPESSLEHRWARATALHWLLNQVGAGGNELPLSSAAFDPFKTDLDAINEKYDATETFLSTQRGTAGEDTSKKRYVEDLLYRLHAYLSWGLRHQADTERDVDRTLTRLGFRLPPPAGDIVLLNIVAPAVLLVVGVAACTSLVFDALEIYGPVEFPRRTIGAIISCLSALGIYGFGTALALRSRIRRIAAHSWQKDSVDTLLPIAVSTGLVAWLCVILSTLAGVSAVILKGDLPSVGWPFVIFQAVTTSPWIVVGGALGVLIVRGVEGNPDKITLRTRSMYAALAGVTLGCAGAFACIVQLELVEFIKGFKIASMQAYIGQLGPIMETSKVILFSGLAGVVGAICGGVLGFIVPTAYKNDLARPRGIEQRRLLEDLKQRAKELGQPLGDGERWVFEPNDDLDGLTPAEAIRYREFSTSVYRLLEHAAPINFPAPTLLQGGRVTTP